jgi:hypothetical protein
VDLGDWQELARLRFENHVWHRCIAEIVEAIEVPGTTAEAITARIEQSVAALNDQLVRLHRRPVGGAHRV